MTRNEIQIMDEKAMDTLQAIEARRSVKHYDPQHEISDEEIEKLLKAARLSPTSFNIQNWRFVLVRNKEQKAKIREAAWNQAQISDASLCVVLCADLMAWDREPARYWKNAPENVRNALVPMIRKFYQDNSALQRDEALRSIGIAAQTLMLASKAMGYDSCPMIGFDPNKVAEIIRLPKDHIIGMIVVIGKQKEAPRERGGQIPSEEVVFLDWFN